MFRTLILAAALVAVPATAVTVVLTPNPSYTIASFDAAGNPIAGNVVLGSNSVANNDVAFYTATLTFDAGAAPTNAVLDVDTFAADDRAVVLLNGVSTGFGVGIFGPGVGEFFFNPTGGTTPFTFAGNGSGITTPITLLAGQNTVTVIVNNNNNGIFGSARTGGPSNFTLEGVITFDQVGGIPEASTWAMMIAGFGLVGFAARRRRVALAV